MIVRSLAVAVACTVVSLAARASVLQHPLGNVAYGWGYTDLLYEGSTPHGHHGALDFGSPAGTPVVAAAGGVVRTLDCGACPPADDNHDMGKVVIIDHGSFFTLYAHLSAIDVDVANGSDVDPGEQIGSVGNTGCVNHTPPCDAHLHFEVKYQGGLGNRSDAGPRWGYSEVGQHPSRAGWENPHPLIYDPVVDIGYTVIESIEQQEVRTGPDPSYTVNLAEVDAGERFVAHRQLDDWYLVDLPSSSGASVGWVRGSQLPGSVYRVDVDGDPEAVDHGSWLNVRASPDAANPANVISRAWDDQRLTARSLAAVSPGCDQGWISLDTVHDIEFTAINEFGAPEVNPLPIEEPGTIGYACLGDGGVTYLDLVVGPSAPDLEDDFDTGLDLRRWAIVNQGKGPVVLDQLGAASLVIPEGSVGDPWSVQLGSHQAAFGSPNCKLSGDFELEMSFDLPIWPFENGARVALVVAEEGGGLSWSAQRVSFGSIGNDFPGMPRDAYLAWDGSSAVGVVPASGSSGRLRIVRSGSDMTTFYFDAGGWVPISGFPVGLEDLLFGVSLFSHDQYLTPPVGVWIDRLVVHSGLTCAAPGCVDGIDNDQDGAIDVADVGCTVPGDAYEKDAQRPCDDGWDTDLDGASDLADLGCGAPGWPREDPACQDGFDNDGQTGIDFDGGASVNGGIPLASPDPQCAAPWRKRETSGCGLGFEIVGLLPLLGRLGRARSARNQPGRGDPPRTLFITRTFPFEREFRRP